MAEPWESLPDVAPTTASWEALPDAPAASTAGWEALPDAAPEVAPSVRGFTSEDIAEEMQPTADEARLKHAFEESRRQGSRATQVLRVATALGVPTRQVELNLDVFQQAADEVGDDARRFQKDNPLLASVILQSPHLGPAVLVDKQAGDLLKAYRKALDWAEDAFGLMTESEVGVEEAFAKQMAEDPDAAAKVDLPALAAEAKAAERTERDKPRQVEELDTPEARAIRNQGGLVGGALTLWRRGKEMRARLQLSDAQSRLAWAEYQGDEDTAERLRADIYNAKLANTPEALGESGLLADAVQSIEGGVSTLSAIEGGVKGAGLAATVVGGVAALGTLVATKSPAAAGRAGLAAGKVAAGPGAKVGAAAATFGLEFGPAYEELRALKTDADKALTVEEAFGAAVFIGSISSSLELLSLGKQLQPLNTAQGALTGKLRQMLATDPTARALAKRLAREWASGVAAEGLTEGAQEAVKQLGKYLAASKADDAPQRRGPFEVEAIIESGVAGLKGGALFATVGVGAAAVTARTMAASQQQAKQVPVLLAMAANETIHAAPADFAQVVQQATAEGGAPVTALHVDGAAALRYFQENEADPDAAMVAALGPDGPKRVAEAAESGGRIEVGVEEVLATWGTHPAAQALLADTATQPGLMTPAELRTRGPEVQAEATRLAEEELYSATEDEAFESALADQVDTLVSTRRVGVRDAKAWGLLARRVWETAAKRQGIAPAALLQQMSITFARGNEGQMQLGEEATLAERRAILGPPPGPRQALEARRGSQRLDTPEGLEARRRDFFIDSTTGLLNARAWQRIEQTATSVASISIEGVKFSNDTLGGHAAGDATYAAAAQALAPLLPGLAKVGGDFAVADLTQEQLDAVLEEANRNPALQGYRLTGVVAESRKKANKMHNAAKVAAEKAGARAPRGSRPLGAAAALRLDAKPLEGRAIPEELLPQLPETALAFDEEHFEATGLLTKDGRDRYLERHPKKHWVALDLNLLKAFNDLLDDAAGDQVLDAFGKLLAELGGERFIATHVSGDEYSLHGDNLVELEQFAGVLADVLLERVVTVTTADGKEASWRGLSFGVGVGENVDAAEGSLNEHKARMAEEGLRGATPEEGKQLVAELLGGASLSERSLAVVAEGRRRASRERALRRPAGDALRRADAGGEGGRGRALSDESAQEAAAADDAAAAGLDSGEVGRVAAEASGADPSRAEEADAIAAGLNSPQAFENARAAVKRMRVGVTKAEREAKTKKAKKAARRQSEDRHAERVEAFTAFLDWAQGVGPRPVPAGGLTSQQGALEVHPEALREAVLFFRNEFDIVDPDTGISDLMRDAQPAVEKQLRRGKRQAATSTYQRELQRDKRLAFEKDVLGRVLSQDEDKVATPRGYIALPEDTAQHATFAIFLNKRADASTIIHESGHAWLEMLHVLGRRADATAETLELVARARRWLGASEDLSVPLTREQHETFARGFEAYLFEGRAPVAELEGVFARFKAWLVSLYRTIRSLNVDLNDDARGVFDSLLATEEELQAYRRDSGPGLWASAEEAGMSPEAWEQHLEAQREADESARTRVAAQALRERQRELETWWQEQRARLAAEVSEEYEALPARIAQRGIREGVDVGEARGEPVWFDRQAAIDLVGPHAARRVPTVLEGGTHPDEVADFYGYGSGGELLGAVAGLPSKERYVDLETSARLREEYPSMVDEREQLREALAKADKASKRTFILEELAVLARQAGGKAPAREAIQQAAERIVGDMRLRALIPARALAKERKAAQEKARAAAAGDAKKALEAGTQQLLQAAVYQEMLGAKAERESLYDLAREMSTDKARARWGKASPVYRDAIDFLVTATQLRGKARLTAGQWAEGWDNLNKAASLMEADAVTVGDWVAPLGLLLAKNDWRAINVKEMRALTAALENLRAAARTRNTVLLEGRRVEKDVVVGLLLKEPVLPVRKPPGTASADTLRESLAHSYNAALGFVLAPPDMLRELVGDNQDSVWWKAVMEPLREGKQREADILDAQVKPIVEAFEKVPKAVRARMWEAVDGQRLFPGHVGVFQPPRRRFELLMMALNMGNAGNKQRLLDGRGITETQVVEALDVLTREELDWVQSIFDAAEALRPAAFSLEERDSGLRPEAVAAVPLKLKAGTLRGGYFPAVYERVASTVGERQAGQALADLMDPSYTRGGTPHSHLKKRADKVEAVISLEPDVIYRHMAQVAHDLAFREAVKSVGSIIMDPQVDQLLKSRLGDGKARQFLQWVKDAGSNRGAIPNHFGQKVILAIRRNAAPAILGWSLPTAVGDLANLGAAVASTPLDTKHLAAGLMEYRLSPAVREEALKKSPELRFMRDTVRRDFAKQVQSLTARGPLARGPLAWWRDNAFLFMETISAATATPVWLGAYKQALDAGRLEGEAVKWADDILTRVFPSHSPIEQAAILRDKGFWGMVTMFYGYLSVMFRAQYHLIRKRKLAALVGLWVTAGVFGELLMGRGPEAGDADDEKPEDEKLRWRNWFVRKLIAAPLSTLPFEAAGTFEARVLGKPTNPRGSPVNALLDTVLDNAGKALDGDEAAAERGLAAIRAVAPLTGIPIRPFSAAGSYLTNAEDDDGPLDVAAGLVYGKRKDQPANVLRPGQ